jgi:OHCU decarboxylase
MRGPDMNETLGSLADRLDRLLGPVDDDLRRRFPGDPGTRQPVHTVYVPADRYHADLVRDWGQQARLLLDTHAPTVPGLAEAMGLDPVVAPAVDALVRAKLDREPVEDLRIDFEDGYGEPGDDAEDESAVDAAKGLAAALRDGHGPPFSGIRFKSLEAATRRRGLRTLDLFVSTLAGAYGGLPDGFVVTLPKVSAVEQVAAMAEVCAVLETAHGLEEGRLRFEIQVETPQAIVAADGTAAVARMIHAAGGRCTGLHYGTYDYSAACGVSGDFQSLEHPVSDHAKDVMQAAAAGTGVRLSDGSTNVLPVGGAEAVRSAWALHARLVRRSLQRGIYQGWDLHPGQLPSRFAATFAFYRHGLPSAAERLRAYVGGEDSGFLDEPATARALGWFLARGLDCGAVTEAEIEQRCGLDGPALRATAGARAAVPPAPAEAADGALDAFNALPKQDARELLRACCDAPAWVAALLEHRPYADRDALLSRADRAARALTGPDVARALSAHPRIGERAGHGWSRDEQAGVRRDASTREALAEANREYEQRFGRVFLICATGLDAPQILSALRSRLTNDDATEAGVVGDELRKIALLRLRKALDRT